MASKSASTLYLGLAGETGRDRVVHTGLYRLADGANAWEPISAGLPDAPAIRALAVHPRDPATIFAGTQSGAYRSGDRGAHWERLNTPDRGQPVWSFLFHPADPDVMFIGGDHAEIFRSDDGSEHFARLPVHVRFPDVTTAPGANPSKRVLMMDASATAPETLYAAIEVGGTLRSTDGGAHWECLSHGQYLNDDYVDMHGILASRWQPGTVIGIGRAGMFCSRDGGDHWRAMKLEPTNEKGQLYCRDIKEVPGNPRKIWLAAGINFQSDTGLLLRSDDGGESFRRVDMGMPAPHTMFKLAIDDRRPERISCATNGGEVYDSRDGGESWTTLPAPPGGTQVYALARG